MCSMPLRHIHEFTTALLILKGTSLHRSTFLLLHQELHLCILIRFIIWHIIEWVNQSAIIICNLGLTLHNNDNYKKALMHVRLCFILVLIFLGVKGVFWHNIVENCRRIYSIIISRSWFFYVCSIFCRLLFLSWEYSFT